MKNSRKRWNKFPKQLIKHNLHAWNACMMLQYIYIWKVFIFAYFHHMERKSFRFRIAFCTFSTTHSKLTTSVLESSFSSHFCFYIYQSEAGGENMLGIIQFLSLWSFSLNLVFKNYEAMKALKTLLGSTSISSMIVRNCERLIEWTSTKLVLLFKLNVVDESMP